MEQMAENIDVKSENNSNGNKPSLEESKEGGFNNKTLETMLVLTLLILGFFIIYTYQNIEQPVVADNIKAKSLDSSFKVVDMKEDKRFVNISIEREGGIEDYSGMQIFLEDSFGKVIQENFYLEFSNFQTNKFVIRYNNRLANIKYITIVPII